MCLKVEVNHRRIILFTQKKVNILQSGREVEKVYAIIDLLTF